MYSYRRYLDIVVPFLHLLALNFSDGLLHNGLLHNAGLAETHCWLLMQWLLRLMFLWLQL